MLTSVASSCVRGGRKLTAPVARFLTSSSRSPNLSGGSHRLLLLPTAATQLRSSGLLVRRVSLSTSCPQRDANPVPSASEPDETEPSFGSLSTDISSRRSFQKSSRDMHEQRIQEQDPWEGEEEAEEDVRRPRRTNTPYWYFLRCKKLIKEKKLQGALDLFHTDMLKVERLQPEEYNYTVLIGGCGRAGQLKTAFKLYNDMKKRGLEPIDATYTALFNACAMAPFKAAGLQQALKLEQELRRKNYKLSTITYHALLKTHAVTNHLQACVHTLKEMLQNGHVVTQETFHYLLMGCVKNKESGFRLALQVWRQMLKSGIRPDSNNYTLLLRTARDCGIGDLALASSLLLRSGPEMQNDQLSLVQPESGSEHMMDIELLEQQLFVEPASRGDGEESVSESKQLIPIGQTQNASLPVPLEDGAAPNLLDVFEGRNSAVVSLGAVSGASDRLALIGGGKGFLDKMAANGLGPDLRTLTLLADTMEPGHASLQTLLRAAKQNRVKLDVAFFNTVIRRSARARDLEGAKSVLRVMRQRHVSVDVQTFGSLALGCERKKDGLQLLKDMEEAGLRPNVHVFSTLIGRAAQRLDYIYLQTLLKAMTDKEVWPNEVIIKQLEFAAQYPPNYDKFKSRNNYLVQIDGFRGYYQQWLKYMPAAEAEDKQGEVVSEAAAQEEEPADGLTLAQRNRRAAARRVKPA